MAKPSDPIVDLGEYAASLDADQVERFAAAPWLTDTDRTILERALAQVTAHGWRSSPLAMGQHFGALDPMPHTRLLSRKFVDAVRGRSTRQIWCLPPQHGKSLIASQWGPAWALEDDPTIPVALTSYGDTLAQRNSAIVRDLVVEHADQLLVRLLRDQRRRDRFVTDQGGGLIAAGVGSSLTGFGAQGIVVDDPHKNWQEAHSEAARESVWNWYRSVVRSRLWDRPGRPGWIIVVATRWHEDDLIGKLLAADQQGEGEGWELIRLPAIAEDDDDLLGRQRGEALAPELFDIQALRARAQSFGAYLTAGLEQQRPAPEEGGEIKRAWWRWDSVFPSRFDDSLTSWDMKMKDKESGDFVVGQAWGRTGTDFWCLDQLRGQWNLVTAKTAIALLAVRHPTIARHVIENAGNGPEVMAELRRPQPGYTVGEDVRSQLGITDLELPKVNGMFRRGIPGLLPENVKYDKIARVRAVSPYIEAGNVHLPDGKDFALAIVNEAAAFPNGAHDDQVDTFSQALKRLAGAPAAVVRTADRPIGKPRPGARSTPANASVGRVGGRRIGRPGGRR